MIQRNLYDKVITGLQNNPAVALLGPRQTGKTTLAQQIANEYPSVYLDLENPVDAAKLQDPPIHYLSAQTGKLVILDEIQRTPTLFQPLRSIIDQNRSQGNGTGQFLILGSAYSDPRTSQPN